MGTNMAKQKKPIAIKSRKAKGRNFQQTVGKRISKMLSIPIGKDELIRSREMGQSGVDIVLLGKASELFPFSCEVKNVEKLNFYAAIQQSKDNQKEGTEWLLFCKKNYHEPIVVMDMEVFFRLYEELLELRKRI